MKKAAVPSILIAVTLLAVAVIAEAQQPAKVPRIGWLPRPPRPSTTRPGSRHFANGLRELGYVEGKNIIIEYRYAEGKVERLPDLAAELVRLKVESSSPPSTAAVHSCQEGDARRFPSYSAL